MMLTCGACRPFSAIKTFSSRTWNIEQSTRITTLFLCFADQNFLISHPSHSLLRFLLSSNSLDLIIDVALEMWSAVIGKLNFASN